MLQIAPFKMQIGVIEMLEAKGLLEMKGLRRKVTARPAVKRQPNC
jgi:hypothetical protein